MSATARGLVVGGLVVVLASLSMVPAGAAQTAGDTPLIAAVKHGDTNTVVSRLAAGDDVNQTAPDGSTALHWATHGDNVALVATLLAAGAEATAINHYGVQPIVLAAENGNAAVLGALLEAGAAASYASPDGETVLMTAARNGDAASIRVLLAAGADPDAREPFRGQTALMWAAARNNAAAVHALAELGADVHAKTAREEETRRRLFWAAEPTGFTALMFAARGGHLDAVRVLLDAGAEVNDTLSDGRTVLIVAVANANWAVADYLLDRGAAPNQATAGWTALHQVVRSRRMNCCMGFPGPIPTGNVDSTDLLRTLIALGGDVNARMRINGMQDGQRNRLNRLGATPFFLASKSNDTEAMQVLLDAGADPLVPNADGTTALMVAAGVAVFNPGEDGGTEPAQEAEMLRAVTTLVELGHDVNAVNYRGETPLQGAAFRGANTVVEYLVDRGADLDARNDLGYSALAIALGFIYTDTYKQQTQTADLLRRLMTERGISTEGEGHSIPGSVCVDCLTRADQYADRMKWEAELEAEFNAALDAEATR